jgi:hypothetical protein
MSLVFSGYAQSRKQRKEELPKSGPTSLDPLPRERHLPKEARKRSKAKGPTYNAERDYYERVEDFGKTRRKNEKMLMTPQYSDPSYFGHKRPPKKRPPDKMKFCKECGIRH